MSEIRYITESDDRKAISRIYEESWKYAYSGIIPQEYLESIPEGRWADRLDTPGWNTMVCIDEGIFIGTSSFCKSRFDSYPDSGEIISIYFLPEYMKKGFGSKLLAAILDELKEQGYDDVFLWVLEENMHARQFYEKNGFSRTDDYREDVIGGKTLREVRYVYQFADSEKMTIEYRPAVIEDAKMLVNIYNASFYDDYMRFGSCPGYGNTKEMMEESILHHPKHIILCDDEPVGCVSYTKLGMGEYEVSCLCVVPDFQGKGIGTHAIRFLKTFLEDWKKLTLVTPIDKNENVRFYTEKCGFHIESTERDGNVELARFVAEKYEGESIMGNPWEEISLENYENHMRLDSVKQLQTMNSIMKNQFDAYPVDTAMVLGVAGGNGLEHVSREKYRAVYGVDINEDYLRTVTQRYSDISDILICLKIDLINETNRLPHAQLLIANLLIEYIGYEAFQNTVRVVDPEYVSCVIQINTDEKEWVSDSPYIHAFDRLDEVHHQMEEESLSTSMMELGYKRILQTETPLPNGKALLRIDYKKE